MRRNSLCLTVPGLLLVAAASGACSHRADDLTTDSGAITPDPSGTTRTAIRSDGQGPDLLNFEMGDITVASTNQACTDFRLGCYDMALDSGDNFHACGKSIVDVGSVSGLGEVTTIPTSGYASSASAILHRTSPAQCAT